MFGACLAADEMDQRKRNGAPLPSVLLVLQHSQMVVALPQHILERVFPRYNEKKNSPSHCSNTWSSASHNHTKMSQYHDFDPFTNLNDATGSHTPTPPLAYLTVPSTASTAGYRGLEGGLSLFPRVQTPLPRDATSNHETPHDRLLVLQDTMRWVVQSQHKLLEEMKTVRSTQARVEEIFEALRAHIIRLSEDFENWKRGTGSEVSSSHCDACEGDRDTDTVVDDGYLP